MAFELNNWNLLPDGKTEACFEDSGHGLRIQVQEQITEEQTWKSRKFSAEEIFAT